VFLYKAGRLACQKSCAVAPYVRSELLFWIIIQEWFVFKSRLTPNMPVAHTSFTYRKLNMDGFSVLNGFLGYVDSTQKIFLKFFHAQGLFQTS
jgi:hypothetical protein